MLSWASNDAGNDIDLTAVAKGDFDGADPLPFAAELLRFASACAGTDPDELVAARTELSAATDVAFMVDAAAVAANFEMMTRLADGTGASLGAHRIERSAAASGAMGVADLVSRR